MKPEYFVVEVLDHHGRVTARERIACAEGVGSATVGRSLAATVMIDDAHAAPIHARIDVGADGVPRVSDLGSVNGLVLKGTRQHGLQDCALPDGLLQVGRTRLRVRTAAESLPAEKPEHAAGMALLRHPERVAVLMAALYLGLGAYSSWLTAPRDLAPIIVTALTTEAVFAAIWIFAWALVSRILLGEWRGWRHAALFLAAVALGGVASALLEIAWFMFSLPSVGNRDTVLGVLVFMPLLYGHLAVASNLKRRAAILIAGLLPLAVAGSALWVQWRGEARNVNHIGGEQVLYPPFLRLRQGESPAAYFERAATLHERAEARRKALPADDDGRDEDED